MAVVWTPCQFCLQSTADTITADKIGRVNPLLQIGLEMFWLQFCSVFAGRACPVVIVIVMNWRQLLSIVGPHPAGDRTHPLLGAAIRPATATAGPKSTAAGARRGTDHQHRPRPVAAQQVSHAVQASTATASAEPSAGTCHFDNAL